LEVGEIEEVTPEVIEQLSKQMAEETGGEEQLKPEIPEETETERKTGGGGASDVEIEKIKVMIDTIRERSRVTEETIQSISEGIGEMRSMVFQIDASIKEMGTKMEKVEDDVSEVRPQEVAKKFRETSENLNNTKMEFEKLQTKVTDIAGKINEITELIKGIGGIENLVDLNKNIQERVNDINEAEKYIERIGTKTEKMFIDLSKGLEDLVIIRAKQDDLDGSLKDINKSIDALNVRFGSYFTIKDMEEFKQEFLFVKKQMEEVSKILPIAELKLPEDIIKLRREREDIKMLLDSVDEQFLGGKMSEKEYENVKSGNMKKLERIERRLKEEWKRFEAMMGGGEVPVESVEVEEPGVEKKVKVVKKAKKKRKKAKKEKTKKETEAARKRKILSGLKRFK